MHLNLQNQLRDRLTYDKSIYDSAYSKRSVIRKTIESEFSSWKKINLPYIEWYEYDLDSSDEPDIMEVLCEEMPPEFWIFFEEYRQFPSVLVKLYPPDTILKILDLHTRAFRSRILNDEPIENTVCYIPICYSKHFAFKGDQNYINVLCFVCVIDPDLEDHLPEENERYYVFELDLDNLEDKCIHFDELEKKLTSMYILDIDGDTVNNMGSIIYGWDRLIKQHHFNL